MPRVGPACAVSNGTFDENELKLRKGTPCRIQGFGVVEVLYGKNPRGSGKK